MSHNGTAMRLVGDTPDPIAVEPMNGIYLHIDEPVDNRVTCHPYIIQDGTGAHIWIGYEFTCRNTPKAVTRAWVDAATDIIRDATCAQNIENQMMRGQALQKSQTTPPTEIQ